jgi:hypothetical protein
MTELVVTEPPNASGARTSTHSVRSQVQAFHASRKLAAAAAGRHCPCGMGMLRLSLEGLLAGF